MFWQKKAIEPPTRPITSSEYEKVFNLIVEQGAKIALLKGEMAGLQLEFQKMQDKVLRKIAKTPEETPVSSGLPNAAAKGLNTFNPFL